MFGVSESVAGLGTDRPAIRATGCDDLSYADLAAVLNAAGNGLAKAGVAPGDTVALFMPPTAETAALALAVMAVACAAPLSPALPAAALSAALETLRPRLLLISPGTSEWVGEVARRHGVPVGIARPDGTGRAGAVRLTVPTIGPSVSAAGPADRVLLLPTSGSTGVPKLVPLSRRQVQAGADAVVRSLALGSGDTVLHTLPMHHVGGLVDVLIAPLISGGTVVVSTPFSAPEVLQAIETESPTWLQLAPAMLLDLLDERQRLESSGTGSSGTGSSGTAGSLRLIRSVSAPLPPSLLHRAEDVFGAPVIEIYGMTETAGVITSNPLTDRRVGTVGVAVDVTLRVVGPDGCDVAPGAEGEVLVRGPSVITGYLPRDAEQPFTGQWLHTGDLGTRDHDGYLRITGRLKDAINRGGEMISPATVDRALLEHPDVADAAAFGAPHASLGELVAAVVVGRPGAVLSRETLQAFVADRLPPTMVPRPIIIADDIPRINGKLRRADLVTLLPETAAGSPAQSDTPLIAVLTEMWREVLGVEVIGRDDDFFALGGNSLRAASLVARLSELANDIIYVAAIFEGPTVALLEDHLQRHYPRAAATLAGEAPEPVPHLRVTEPMIGKFRAAIHQPEALPASVAPRNPRAAFILSAPRSGSTLLRSMLAGHPGLFAPPELYLLAYRDLADRTRHFPPPHVSQLEGAVRALMQAEHLDAISAEERIRSLEAAGCTTTEFYGLLQRAVAGRLLVDKTPANALTVAALMRAEKEFEQPVYIHLVRHPSAMVASFTEANLASLWAPRVVGPDAPASLLDDLDPSQLGELLWLVLNENINEFLADVPAQRVVRVRFEDLVTDPARTLEPVCESLGVDFSPRLLDPYDRSPDRMTDGLHRQSRMIGDPKFHRHERIDSTRGDRWRTERPVTELSHSTRSMALASGYRDLGRSVRLTSGQERVLALARLNPNSSVYNVPLGFRLHGDLDLLALDQALTELQNRHPVLRASFPSCSPADGGPRLEISDPGPVVAPLIDFAWVREQNDPATADREFLRLAEAEARRPFDLESGPLWRACVFREGDSRHLLVLSLHHIVFDGLSRAVLLDELGALYGAAAAGRAAGLAPPSATYADATYADVIARQAAMDAVSAERDWAYWSSRFDPPAEPLRLPADHERPDGPGQARSIRVTLPPQDGVRIEAFCRTRGVTPAAAWLAATAMLLARWTGQLDQVVCIPTSGRRSLDAQSMIGYFNRVVPVRLDLSGDPCAEDVIAAAMRRIIEAVDHDGIGLQSMATLAGLARISLSSALVSYQEVPDTPLTLAGVIVEPFPVRKDASDFDVAIHVERMPSQVSVVVDYNAGIFEESTITEFARLLGHTVGRVVADPSARLSALPEPGAGPSDVQSALIAHPKIDECAVAVRSGRVDAYLVLNEYDVPTLREIVDHARSCLPAYRVPSAFVTLDHLPRTPDGAVDREALPTPLQEAPVRDLVLPRDDLERAIADIWRAVLWFDGDIGIHDSFRALGGHSLLSVQVVAMLERHLDAPIAPGVIPHLDTIAGLATALRSTEHTVDPWQRSAAVLPDDIRRGLLTHTSTWAGVRHAEGAVTVGLNIAGTRPALFWCLQNNHEHEALARHLGTDQPVYAMRSGNRVMVKSDENIELLARHYVEEILQIQPAGPYIVGGNCQAARIGLRIANLLVERGHEVPLLFMMEKFDPVRYDGAVAMLFGAASDRNPYRYFTEPHIGYRKWYSGPIWIRQMSGAHGQFFTEPNIASLAGLINEHLRGLSDPGALPPPASLPCDAPAPPGSCAYRARVRLASDPVVRTSGTGAGLPSSIMLELEVTNVSAEDWPGGPLGGIAVGCRWLTGDHQDSALAAIRPLAAPTPTGHTVRMSIEVPAPPDIGEWALEVDVIEQGVAWFQDKGSAPLRISSIDVATTAALARTEGER